MPIIIILAAPAMLCGASDFVVAIHSGMSALGSYVSASLTIYGQHLNQGPHWSVLVWPSRSAYLGRHVRWHDSVSSR